MILVFNDNSLSSSYEGLICHKMFKINPFVVISDVCNATYYLSAVLQ